MPSNITSSDSIAVQSQWSGGTVAPSLPETGFLRQRQVLFLVPISKATLWRRVQASTFPKPLKLSERVTVWRAEDIRHWIEQQRVP